MFIIRAHDYDTNILISKTVQKFIIATNRF